MVADLVASRGYLGGSFAGIMRNPELLERIQKLGEYIRYHCGLDLRINRMAGLMIMNVTRTPVPDGNPLSLAPMPQQIRPIV